MRKNLKWLVIGVVVVIALFLITNSYTKPKQEEKSFVEIKAYFVDENGDIKPLQKIDEGENFLSVIQKPGYQPEQTNSLLLSSQITATSEVTDVPIYITDVTGDNVQGTELYDGAIEPKYTPHFPIYLIPGQSDEVRLSNAMDITQIELGDVDFRLIIDYYYYDAEGNIVNDQKISDDYTIYIIPEEQTTFRTSHLDYNSYSAIAYSTTCDGSNLVKYGAGLQRSDTVTCANNPSDHNELLLNLPGDLYDASKTFIGSPMLYSAAGKMPSEEVHVCQDTDIGHSEWVKYRSGDTTGSVTTNPLMGFLRGNEVACGSCVCGDWEDDVLGGGSCAAGEMRQTRVCVPPTCNDEEQCVPQPCSQVGGTCCPGGDSCINGIFIDGVSDCTFLCCGGGGYCSSSSPTYVEFRVDTLSSGIGYDSGSAIAFDDDGQTCTVGEDLRKAGYYISGNSGSGTCAEDLHVAYRPNLIMSGLPGRVYHHFSCTGADTYLYGKTGDPNRFVICSDNYQTCTGGTNSWNSELYDFDDTTGSVELQATSVDSGREKSC